MTRRKGEITTARLRREWPHHVALSADKVRGLRNSGATWCGGNPIGCALTYSLHRVPSGSVGNACRGPPMTLTRLSAEQGRTLKLLASSRDGANEEPLRRLVMTLTCGLPVGAAWSDYGCKPAVRLTRSASLFLTHSSRPRVTRSAEHGSAGITLEAPSRHGLVVEEPETDLRVCVSLVSCELVGILASMRQVGMRTDAHAR